jgi:hypothetical protein
MMNRRKRQLPATSNDNVGDKIEEKANIVVAKAAKKSAASDGAWPPNKSNGRWRSKRKKGKRIETEKQVQIAMYLFDKPDESYRVVARRVGVSLGAITLIKGRLVRAKLLPLALDCPLPTLDAINDALKHAKRKKTDHNRKIGTAKEHAEFVCEVLRKSEGIMITNTLRRLCELFHAQFDISVTQSTMFRFLCSQGIVRRAKVNGDDPKVNGDDPAKRRKIVVGSDNEADPDAGSESFSISEHALDELVNGRLLAAESDGEEEEEKEDEEDEEESASNNNKND